MNQLTKHVQPTSWAEATQLAKDISKSDLVPQGYRGKPDQILCAIQYGAEIGFSPFQALQSIVIISGKASLSGDAMLALVSARPDCEGVSETFEGEGDERRAICEIKRRGWKPTICTFSVADAKQANLWGKSDVWKKYSDRMLQMRARGFAVRNAFQDALKGFISTEEAQDYPVKNSAPVAEAVAISEVVATASIAPPVVDQTTEVPYVEEIQSDPHPKDPEVVEDEVETISEIKKVAVENFIKSIGAELDEVIEDLRRNGIEDVSKIPADQVKWVVSRIAEIAKEKKAGVTHG